MKSIWEAITENGSVIKKVLIGGGLIIGATLVSKAILKSKDTEEDEYYFEETAELEDSSDI